MVKNKVLREYLFIFQNRPKPVDPIDYEKYVVKKKCYYTTILIEYLFIFQNRPKPVDPIDYETYVVKNKVLLHNDPQRIFVYFSEPSKAS